MSILKEITGYSKYEQEFLNVLYGVDWLTKQLNDLRGLGITAAVENQILDNMEIAKEAYEQEKCSLHETVKAIKEMFKEAKGKLVVVTMALNPN